MKPTFLIYNLITTICAPFIFLFILIKGLLDRHFKERLGLLPSELVQPKGKKLRIWIHAVSIGEVTLAKVLARAMKERIGEFSLVLSTTTKSGRQTALRDMPNNAVTIYNPIDLFWCVRYSLRKISPDVFINLEAEIWPNFLWACKKLNIPAFLINGRISERSTDNYRRFSFLIKDVLPTYRLLSMISISDAQRIISIGADPKKVMVGGNAKYDLLVEEAKSELSKRLAAIYKIDDSRPVFIAGSTRPGEEEIVIESYLNLLTSYPGIILIIAPRHIERCGHIESVLRSYNLQYCLRSNLKHDKKKDRSNNVTLVDIYGELFGLYSLGTIIFCGASLVPLGGQNILEAAVWGKPVIYGPSMENFLEAKALLDRVGAGFRVKDKDELIKTATWILENPDESDRLGMLARKGIESNIGSSRKQVDIIFRLFD
jgi:3-deoxy-D-manno-octulosonic-acid transferase